ncbi:MAG: ATP-grasp domain-containing protein [Nitrospinales bacterium]
MKAINILFLAPNWRVSLVNAFQKTLRDLPCPGKLSGADSDPHSPALQVVDRAHVIPRFESPECLGEILTLCDRETIHAIIPLTNRAVEFLDANRTAFSQRNLHLLINDKAVIETCHDKLKLARFFREAGITSPETVPADSPKQKISLPAFAKQRRGEGGKNRMVLQDERDLEFCAAKFPGHVVQPLIRGMEYSIDWFADRNGTPRVIVPRERLAVRASEVMVSRIRLHPEIIDAARRAGLQLGLRGPATLQGILDEAGRFHFTDVNLRFGSGSIHSIAAGADIPLLIYRELLGEPLPDKADSVQDGAVMTRFSDAFYI